MYNWLEKPLLKFYTILKIQKLYNDRFKVFQRKERITRAYT